MAVGARHADVVRLIVRQGMTLALVGVVIGVSAAFGLARLISSMLFGVSPTDPITFLGVAFILGAVAMVASYVPARRAARVDPLIAVRQQ
jgi:ABC-type antimicrobial peptide transport system permease subunit